MVQATSSEDGESDDEEEKSTKRRISFTADLSQGKAELFSHAGGALGSFSTVSPTVGCSSAEENAEVLKDVEREKESGLSLRRSSELLGPSSPSTTVLEPDLSVRDNLDRKPSFNGNIVFCCFTWSLIFTFVDAT